MAPNSEFLIKKKKKWARKTSVEATERNLLSGVPRKE